MYRILFIILFLKFYYISFNSCFSNKLNENNCFSFDLENTKNSLFKSRFQLHENNNSNEVTLTFPKNNATDQPLHTEFTWEIAENSDTYILQISLNPEFDELVYDKLIKGNHTRVLIPLLHSSTYYWHVKTINSIQSSEWSEVWNFKTIEDPYNQNLIEKIKENGISILEIHTVDKKTIDSKEVYVKGNLFVHENNNGNYEKLDKGELEIKGRGNTTWFHPKKSFRIKMSDPETILGMPANRHWILLANHSDKSLLRTHTAFNLSRMFELDYTLRDRNVEVVLNGNYIGVYQLVEVIKIDPERVNITKINSSKEDVFGGAILEVDGRRGEEYNFDTPKGVVFNVSDPDGLGTTDPEKITQRLNYIKEIVIGAENALYSEDFKDLKLGYQNHLNTPSFINWYFVNEILKNTDAIFYTSVYMYIDNNKKLTMGPVWDFDISGGNVDYNDNKNPDGFWIRNSKWISRLFQDPYFEKAVLERWEEIRNDLYVFIDSSLTVNSRILHSSQKSNYDKWKTLGVYVWPNYFIGETYEEEVFYLKQWLFNRIFWLDKQLSQNPISIPPITNDISYQIYQDTNLEGKLLGFHPNSSIIFSLLSSPSHGKITIDENTGAFNYIPNEGFVGEVQFTYTIELSDNPSVISAESFVTIKVLGSKPPTSILLENSQVKDSYPIGTLIGSIYSEDEDEDDFHIFQLIAGEGDDDNGSFEIVNNQLFSKELFDYQNKNTYKIRIQSKDNRDQAIEQSFVITVLQDIIQEVHENKIPDIKFYPNPAYDFLVIEMGEHELNDPKELEIISSTGAIFNPRFSQDHDGKILVEVKNLKSGLYLLRFSYNKGIKSLKFSISR